VAEDTKKVVFTTSIGEGSPRENRREVYPPADSVYQFRRLSFS